MALSFGHPTRPLIPLKVFKLKHHHLIKPHDPLSPPPSLKVFAFSEGTESRLKQEQDSSSAFSGQSSSARTQLDLLEQLTGSSSESDDDYESDVSFGRPTIRVQLANLVGDRDDDFSIPLGKNLKKVTDKFLTVSQKRNIKRQTYLNEVSGRNDSVFFATVGAFVLLPPLVILGVAIATGYVQLFP